MPKLAIIGGTGLTKIEGLDITHREVVNTPFGAPSAPLVSGRLFGKDIYFLRRHGFRHTIPPHRINYRANIWALKQVGVEQVIAVAAVGGIGKQCFPARIVFPEQIVDYTYSRGHTYFEENLPEVTHIDFTEPYSKKLRKVLVSAAGIAKVEALTSGVYGVTQGPRLETAAEIDKLERDGCTLVGMTGMPEAALARELELDYACCAVVANWAAGRGQGEITMDEIQANLKISMENVRKLLAQVLRKL
jgi:5'-methylthioinosine phosphorylase